MSGLDYSLDEQFIKIRQELIQLLVNMEDEQKKNIYLLQLETLIETINN